MNEMLGAPLSAAEIYKALKQMHPSKAPGPDGFSPSFYQQFWDVVGNDVVRAINGFLNSEELMWLVNGTHVTLVQKVKDVVDVTQLRPINLCNVIYKLASKALANRLKPLLDQIVSPLQGAFVPGSLIGSLISDNSLLAYEITHFLKNRRRENVGYGALKVDMSKAYDRVEWPFLEMALRRLGFCSKWVTWVMNCVRTVSYSFLINGEVCGDVQPTKAALSKKVQLLNLTCLLSDDADEDSRHLFEDCSAIRIAWENSPLRCAPPLPHCHTVEEWIRGMLDVLPPHLIALFMTMLWAILVERNKVLWDQVMFNPLHLVQWSSTWLEEFLSCQLGGRSLVPGVSNGGCSNLEDRRERKWCPPAAASLKLNVDGSFFHDQHIGGVRVIMRDATGQFHGAFARHFTAAHSAAHMEAEAIKARLLLAIA